MKPTTMLTLVLALACAPACDKSAPSSDDDAADDGDRAKKKKKKRGKSSPSASGETDAVVPASAPPPQLPPGVAAVRSGVITNPATKEKQKLVETSLAKCYGFKNFSIMLPEGAAPKTMVGARACAIYLPGAVEKAGLVIMTDEIKVKFWERTDLENVTKKILDDEDAFIYEIEEKGKRKTLGWFDTKKLGPHRVQCNSIHEDDLFSVDDELAFIELCRTLKYTDPKQP